MHDIPNRSTDFVNGDALPNAPELAHRGRYPVGVRTLTFVKQGSVNLAAQEDADTPRLYDREIVVEVWYPASDSDQLTVYSTYTGRSDVVGSLRAIAVNGRATRDAPPLTTDRPYPLVVVSHGYPGSRYAMSYLTENLASKGYVVAAIDHPNAIYTSVDAFKLTLFNHPLDQHFVINTLVEDTLSGMIDRDRVALIGYSMGGYGTLANIGAGYNDTVCDVVGPVADPLLHHNGYTGNRHIKAAVLLAPWGGKISQTHRSCWSQEALENVTVPTCWVTGSLDDISLYAGTVRLFDEAIHSERYLLTYANALHNIGLNPPPPEANYPVAYEHHADPSWDIRRVNNINQHFVTAFLEQYLNGIDHSRYLKPPVGDGNQTVYNGINDDTENNLPAWEGFLPRSATGLTLTHKTRQKPS